MTHVASADTQRWASAARQAYALYQEVELLIRLNEYKQGTDPLVDEAVQLRKRLDDWCKQDRFSPSSPEAAEVELRAIVGKFDSIRESSRR